MYKDKEKQREAVKKAVARHRGITKGITPGGITCPVLHLDNGSYIHIDKLIPPKRELLVYLAEHLRYPDNIRAGVFGPTIQECKGLLAITA